MIPALIGLLAGLALRLAPGDRQAWLGPATQALVKVLYPCLIFTSILTTYDARSIRQGLVLPVAVFGVMAAGFVVGLLWARRRPGDTPAQRGTLRFAATMNNYIFLPLLIVDGLWGGAGRGPLVLSALGGDVALWGLGVSCFPTGGSRLIKLINPPILTLTLSVALVLSGHSGFALEGLVPWLTWPGRLALPMAMAVLGFQLGGVSLRLVGSRLAWALTAYRLILVPAAVWGMLALVPLPEEGARVVFMVSTMPVAMATVYLGPFFGGDERLGAGSVLLSHLLAVVTVPVWLWAWGMGSP